MTLRVLRSAAWLTLAAACGLAVFLFFTAPVSLSLTFGIILLGSLALWRPFDALLVVAALGPIAGAVHALTGAPYRPESLLQLGLLLVTGAAAIRASIRTLPLAPTAHDWAAMAFGGLATASAVALLPTTLLRLQAESVASALTTLPPSWIFEWAPSVPVVEQTMLLLEGLALAVLTRRITATAERATRLTWMLLIGAAAAALLNVARLIQISLNDPVFIEGLWRWVRTIRFNVHYGDLNAAGSYFAMMFVVCAWWVSSRANWRTMGILLVPLASALWLTGSRVALAVALVGAAARFALRGLARFARPSRRAVAAGTIAIAVIASVALFALRSSRHGSFGFSIGTRAELTKVGLQMFAERPLTGMGTSQYYALFPYYAPPTLLAAFEDATGHVIERENAHNQFVQILAELGAAGLLAFCVVLVLALRTREGEPAWRPPVIAGLATFLLTALAGHPLLTRHVAYPFWMVIGLAASGAPPASGRLHRSVRAATVALLAVLAATTPLRWKQERQDAYLGGVTLGLSLAQRDESGMRYQWLDQRGTVFVEGWNTTVRVPLRSGDGALREVSILLDGRRAAGVTVGGNQWQYMILPLPRVEGAPRSRRLDFVVDGPRPVEPGRAVMVGKISPL